MATIGNLAVMVTANAEQFLSVMGNAAKRAKAFGAEMNRNLQASGATNGLGQLLAGGNPVEQMKTVGKNLLAAVPGVGGALSSATSVAEGFWHKIRDTQKEMAELGKSAIASGSSIDGYSGILYAAGGNAEMVDKMLFKLSERIGEAATMGGEAAEYFKSLGLSVQQLSSMKADEALLAWDAAVVKLGNDHQRTKAMVDALGKSAEGSRGFLLRGPDWIKARAEFGRASGRAPTEDMVGAAMAASKAWKDLDGAATGLWNRIGAGFAPLTKAIADDFTRAAVEAKKTAAAAQEAARHEKMQADQRERYSLFVHELGKNYLHANFGMEYGRLFDFKGAYERADQSQQGFKESAADELARAKREQAAAMDRAHMKDVREHMERLKEERIALESGTDALERYRLEQKKFGQGDIMAAEGGKRFNEMMKERQDDLKKMAALTEQIRHETSNPRRDFFNKIADIQDAFDAGKMPKHIAEAGAVKAFEELTKSIEQKTPALPRAMTAGSAEAINAVNQWQMANAQGDPAKRVADILKESQITQKKIESNTKDTADALKKQKVVDFN